MLVRKFQEKVNSWCARIEKILSEDSYSVTRILFKMTIYLVFLSIALLCLDLWQVRKGNGPSMGVFGDFFGGVLNPILTFLTFIGLLTTIVLQRQELKQAKSEYDKNSEVLHTQTIETTFFNIVDLHHKIVEDIKVDLKELKSRVFVKSSIKEILEPSDGNEQIVEGRLVFEAILNFILHNSSTPKEVVVRYKKIQDENNHLLGHYFRNLYQALKVIHNYEGISKDAKQKYSSILRAQLSAKELALLFINCLDGVCDEGQFKNLLIEYQMLEHLPIKKVTDKYLIVGTDTAIADDEMIIQYKAPKKLPLDLTKFYGGAFGKNRGIPYNLR